MRISVLFAAMACAALTAAAANAQAPHHAAGNGNRRETFIASALRVDQAPKLDGMLDELDWQKATPISTFTQQEPREGMPATERTEVRILFDSRTLYIGVHAYDGQPGGLVATEMRRDSDRLLDEDNFQLILDTFNDSRNGYMFVTTPLGASWNSRSPRRARATGAGTPTTPTSIATGMVSGMSPHASPLTAGPRKSPFH